MFWRFSYSSSHIQTLLEKEDVTLQEIISEDDVLQECKSNNEKLVDFITQQKNMDTLLSYVIDPAKSSINETTCFKNSTISCELLTCDIPAINDAFFHNIELTNKLYSFLTYEPPLNPLLASYFAKIMGSLILRKTDQFLDYIQSKNDFANLFLKHINTSAIMDILLRFLTTIDNNEMKLRVLDWLNNIKIIEHMIELFSHEFSSEVHSNAAQILCDIIRISREQIVKLSVNENDLFFTPEFNIDCNEAKYEVVEEIKDEENNLTDSQDDLSKNMDTELKEKSQSIVDTSLNLANKSGTNFFDSNPLLNAIENPHNVNRLFDMIFESVGKENCSLKDGVDVLLTLIDENTFYSHFQDVSHKLQDMDFKSIRGVDSVIKNSVQRASCMHKFLKEFKPCVGFGIERLYIVKLIAKLIALDSVEFHNELIRLNTINLILDFMFEFEFNNFLHTQVTNIIKFAFNSLPMADAKQVESTDCTPEKCEVSEASKKSSTLTDHLLIDCKLVQKLVEKWTKYFSLIELESEKKSSKVCYIGHLVHISNLVWNCNTSEGRKCDALTQVLQNDSKLNEEWKALNENKILQINNKFSKELVRNPYNISNNDSNSENEMFELQNNEKINKKYADFQREMKINCVDNFSLSETHISASQPKFPDLFNKLQNVSFQMDSNDGEATNLFEQMCQQRDNLCFNSNSDEITSNLEEDAWVSKEIKFSETFNSFSPSSKVKKNVMDISEDDYNFDKPKDNTEEVITKSSLTKTLFQKNNSSLTCSSSSSSSDDDQDSTGDQKKVKKTSILFKLEESIDTRTKPVDMTNSNVIKFEIDKNSKLEQLKMLESTDRLEKMSTNETDNMFNDADSPLRNVEWIDFSSFSSQKANNNDENMIPLSDPWTKKEALNEEVGSTSESAAIDNWANFD